MKNKAEDIRQFINPKLNLGEKVEYHGQTWQVISIIDGFVHPWSYRLRLVGSDTEAPVELNDAEVDTFITRHG